MLRAKFKGVSTPLFDAILVSIGLLMLVGMALAIKTTVPIWIIGAGALAIIVLACAAVVWRYQPIAMMEEPLFIPEGMADVPELHDVAEAARRTL